MIAQLTAQPEDDRGSGRFQFQNPIHLHGAERTAYLAAANAYRASDAYRIDEAKRITQTVMRGQERRF